MSQRFSIGHVNEFFADPVWREILGRIEGELTLGESRLEDPDPFNHGRAVGARNAFRTVRAFSEIILNEAKGETVYGGRNKGNGAPADVR